MSLSALSRLLSPWAFYSCAALPNPIHCSQPSNLCTIIILLHIFSILIIIVIVMVRNHFKGIAQCPGICKVMLSLDVGWRKGGWRKSLLSPPCKRCPGSPMLTLHTYSTKNLTKLPLWGLPGQNLLVQNHRMATLITLIYIFHLKVVPLSHKIALCMQT